MQFLVKLERFFNVMFSSAVMWWQGLLLWQRTTAESKHCSHQTQREWDDEKRMSCLPNSKSRMKETK